MWTYLVIFLSIAVVVGVFVRKAILYFKKTENLNTDKGSSIKMEDEDINDAKKRISKTDKELVEDLCKEGDLKLKAGKEEEAIKFFVQALAINECHIETQQKLAMLYMEKRMFAAAAALFKSLGTLTGEAVHYSHLGLALFQQNLFEEAKEAYQKAVDLDPSRPQRFASLAQVYRSLGQLQNAIIALNKAVEIDNTGLDFLFMLIDIQTELKNFDLAIDITKRVLEIDPANEEAKKYLRTIQKEKKKGEEGGKDGN